MTRRHNYSNRYSFDIPLFQETSSSSFRTETIARVPYVYPASLTHELSTGNEKDLMIVYRKEALDRGIHEAKTNRFQNDVDAWGTIC